MDAIFSGRWRQLSQPQFDLTSVTHETTTTLHHHPRRAWRRHWQRRLHDANKIRVERKHKSIAGQRERSKTVANLRAGQDWRSRGRATAYTWTSGCSREDRGVWRF